MPWFRVDDDLAFHPKAIAAGNAALGLWVRAGAYAAQYLTEGFLPRGMVAGLDGNTKAARALVDAGLWVEVDGGYRFHQWEDRQPTKAQVEADRAAAAERQRRARDKARESRRDARSDVPRDSRRGNGVSHGPPGPARPFGTKPAGAGLAADPGGAPPGGQPETAQVLLAEWIDHCGERPPSRVVGQVAAQLGEMLTEGIPYADVRAGLAAWHRKNLNPSALASVVHETRTPRPPRVTTARAERDQLFADWAAITEKYPDGDPWTALALAPEPAPKELGA